MTFRETMELVRSDCEVYNRFSLSDVKMTRLRYINLLMKPQMMTMLFHRLSHFFHVKGCRRLAHLFYLLNCSINACDIHPASEIGPGCIIVHTIGVVVFGRIGANAILFPRVVISAGRPSGELAEAPTIGDNVSLGMMAYICGPIHIADNVFVREYSWIDFNVEEPNCSVQRLVTKLEEPPVVRLFESAVHAWRAAGRRVAQEDT